MEIMDILKRHSKDISKLTRKIFLIEDISNHIYGEEDSEYQALKNLNIGDKYLDHSIDYNVPIKDQRITIYEVTERFVDKNNNIIIIIEQLEQEVFKI